MIKKFIAGALVLGLAFFATQASAAFMYTGLLKQGVTSSSVMSLQQTLNMTSCKVAVSGTGSTGMESSYFGAKTAAAVECFQSANGLKGDGVVGAMTAAKLAAVTSSTTVNIGLPAGCSSTAGYSPVNGAPCSGTAGSTVVYPAGCTSSMGYSSTTGQACSGSMTVNNSSAPLSINNVSSVSGNLNTAVGVGQVDKPVANIRLVTGAGGSANLTGLNVSFFNYGTGDYQFTKYASSVGVWLNGVKVGSMDATQFAQYNSTFSAFIPVTGATLAPNSTNNIVLSVTALPTIDSVNMAGDIWLTDITSIRYSDSTGVFTYTPSNVFGNATAISAATSGNVSAPNGTNTYFSFSTSASAQSIKLTVTRDINDSNDKVVVGSSSANTNGVTLALIDLNAQGSNISVRRLPVTLTVAGAATLPNAVINTLRLYDANGTQLDSQAVDSTGNVTFQNLNLAVVNNSTVVLTVKGDFNTVGSVGFTAGDSAKVSVTSGNVANIQAYDSGSNVLTGTSYLTGSTTGNNVSMYVNGINVTAYGTPMTSVSPAGGAQTHSSVTYTIPFSVTAFGAVAYIPSTAAAATSASATNKIQFCIDATSACQAAGSGIVSYLGNDSLTASGNGTFQIPIGQTKNFQLVITYQPGSAISTRASLLNVNWSAADATSGGTWSTYTSGLTSNSFKTPYAAAQ